MWLKGYLSKTPGPKVSRVLGLFVADPCPHGIHYDPDEKDQQEHHRPIRPLVKYPEHAIEREAYERPGNERAGQAFFCEALDV